MADKDIILESDGPGSYKFHFLSQSGELFGRVTVDIEGPPDNRSVPERERAARKQIRALSAEFAKASGG